MPSPEDRPVANWPDKLLWDPETGSWVLVRYGQIQDLDGFIEPTELLLALNKTTCLLHPTNWELKLPQSIYPSGYTLRLPKSPIFIESQVRGNGYPGCEYLSMIVLVRQNLGHYNGFAPIEICSSRNLETLKSSLECLIPAIFEKWPKELQYREGHKLHIRANPEEITKFCNSVLSEQHVT